MNKNKTISDFFLTTLFLLLITYAAFAKEPARPQVYRGLPPQKEIKIQEIENLPIDETFEMLKSADFLVDEELLHRAIFVTFHYRDTEAIEYALQYLQLPRVQSVDGKLVNRASDLYVAKEVLSVFPKKAVDKLLHLYENSGPVTRGNVIRVSGQLAGGKAVRNLLVAALDDKSFCEQEHSEMVGTPLRVCDVAYNQLVLRYKIKNVERTLGPPHDMEARGYHINALKLRFQGR